jgi:glycosyltransferase involved in cell wall biosynthesis
MKRLSGILDPQLEKYKASVNSFIDDSRYKKIGRKRNELVARANGKYLCFIDDDDRVSDNYIELLLEGIKKDVDCCSLKGIITEDGENPLLFEHSIKYKIYKTVTDSMEGDIRYERYPNHLNVVKKEHANRFPFPETNHGEDTDYATQMFKAGVLKSEHYIDQVIYYYDYRRK